MSLCAARIWASKELLSGAGAEELVCAGGAEEEVVGAGDCGVGTTTASSVVDGIVGTGVSIGGGVTTEVGTGLEGEEEGRGRRDLVKVWYLVYSSAGAGAL